MTAARTNEHWHWCSLERRDLTHTRARCRCGWASEWLFAPARAVDAGLAHTANPDTGQIGQPRPRGRR